jgi:hypothetical protein
MGLHRQKSGFDLSEILFRSPFYTKENWTPLLCYKNSTFCIILHTTHIKNYPLHCSFLYLSSKEIKTVSRSSH